MTSLLTISLGLFNVAMEHYYPAVDDLPIKHGDFPIRYVK